MIRIKILNESKQLLNEVSFEDAKKTLDGSKFVKRLKALSNIIGPLTGLEIFKNNPEHENFILYIKRDIEDTIPYDIPDNSKGLALLWLKQKLIEDPKGYFKHQQADTRNAIERFFQYNGSQQMPNFINPVEKKDLNKVESLDELQKLVKEATPLYNKYQEERQNKDVESGTEKIYDGPEWTILAAHNKGAACELGKGTSWCTAAPGLHYFNEYYQEGSPLFIFISKENPIEKYQFSYSSQQFMDKEDRSIYKEDIFYKLNKLLISTPGIKEKYPILKDFIYHKVGDRMVQIKKTNDVTYYMVNKRTIMTKDSEGLINHFDYDNQLHRENGPAVYNKYEYQKDPENAPQTWAKHGSTFRIDGPAEIDKEGYKYWLIYGKYINIDPKYKYGGPSIITPDGKQIWRIGVERFTNEQDFIKYIEDFIKNEDKLDEYETYPIKNYLQKLNDYRQEYLKSNSKKLKENKKFVIRILRNT